VVEVGVFRWLREHSYGFAVRMLKGQRSKLKLMLP
jgi:hypothetical protein